MDWFLKQEAGPLPASDQEAFDQWYAREPRNRGAYLRAQAVARSVDNANIVSALRPVTTQTGSRAATPSRRRLLMAASLAALAVLGGGLSLVGLQPPSAAEFATRRGEILKVALADDSTVDLNTDTKLAVEIGRTNRRIRIQQGEAWFQVAKDPQRPFQVEAGDARVQAVGTAFSVRRFETGLQVLVTEGVVEVWNNRDATGRQRLSAGQEGFIAYAETTVRIATAPATTNRLAWRDGNIALAGETLRTAVEEFNRYNERSLVIADPSLSSERLAGIYRLDAPDRFARDVQALLGTEIVVEADRIIIGATKRPPTRP